MPHALSNSLACVVALAASHAAVVLAGDFTWDITPSRPQADKPCYIELQGEFPKNCTTDWSIKFNNQDLPPEGFKRFGDSMLKIRKCAPGRYRLVVTITETNGEDSSVSIETKVLVVASNDGDSRERQVAPPEPPIPSPPKPSLPSPPESQQEVDFSHYPHGVPAWLYASMNVTRGRTIALEDLRRNATVIEESRRRLAVQIDPAFDEEDRPKVLAICTHFLRHCLDEEVVESAMQLSSTNENRKLRGPKAADSFASQLRSALAPSDGRPAVLVIARYAGDADSGRGFVNFFHRPPTKLRGKSAGYFYIALNGPRLKAWDEPATFESRWGAVIGHEILHNLGYEHPFYATRAERDRDNQGTSSHFIVAYQYALRDRIQAALRLSHSKNSPAQ